MGFTGGSRRLVLAVLISAKLASAADPGCSGIIREVFPLGGSVRVEAVEQINSDHRQQLSLYTGNSAVEDLLQNPDTFAFLAVRDETIVGFVVVERRGKFLNILSIAVATPALRHGVGKDLLDRVASEARKMPGIDDVRAVVLESDTGTRAFFAQANFVETEVIPRRFLQQTKGGVLLKLNTQRNPVEGYVPQLQLAPQPQTRRTLVAVEVLPATKEFLHRIDPTLANAD